MAIQVRRGNEADFDASKMLPGEWAVSLDTKYVRMCFSPGIVLRMASYESFEADMELIQGILEECEEIQTAIERIKSEIDEKASLTIEYSNSASLSATRASEEADRAHEEAERAKNYADSAQSATNVQIATKDTAGIIKGGDNHIAEDGTLTLIAETTETTMPNSCEGRLRFKEIRGNTEQSVVISGIKTHGKNILKVTMQTATQNALVATNNGDGTYTLNGTATGRPWFDIGTVSLKANKTYKICGTPKNVTQNGGIYIEGITDYMDYGNGFVYTPTEDVTKKVYISVGVGESTTNAVFKPMVTEDLEATYETFEPYKESSVTFSQPIELSNSDKIINTESGFVLSIGETTEALPIADQVALNSIETFDGTTYLEFDSPLQPEFVAEYGTSNVGGVALEAKGESQANGKNIEELDAILKGMNTILQDAFIPREQNATFAGDANLCVKSGIYRTGDISNAPHGNGFLIVFAWLPNVLIQICMPYTPEYISIRSCWYGVWHKWIKIPTEIDLTALQTAMVNNI